MIDRLTTPWRALFDHLCEQKIVYDPDASKPELRSLTTPSKEIATILQVSDALVSRWGRSRKPGFLRNARNTRWGTIKHAQDFLEHLFFGLSKQSAERQAFRRAYDELPDGDLSIVRTGKVVSELLVRPMGTGLLRMDHENAEVLISERRFTNDVLSFVHADGFLAHPKLVEALAMLASAYENKGEKNISGQISGAVLSRLMKSNDIGVPENAIADLKHVCEIPGFNNAFEHVNNSPVSVSRRMQEYACECCKALKRHDFQRAQDLLLTIKLSLADCDQAVNAIFHLHSGRILLMLSRKEVGDDLAAAKTHLEAAEQLFAELALNHPFLPHVRAYKGLCDCICTDRDQPRRQVLQACWEVRQGFGESCLDPIATAERLLGTSSSL